MKHNYSPIKKNRRCCRSSQVIFQNFQRFLKEALLLPPATFWELVHLSAFLSLGPVEVTTGVLSSTFFGCAGAAGSSCWLGCQLALRCSRRCGNRFRNGQSPSTTVASAFFARFARRALRLRPELLHPLRLQALQQVTVISLLQWLALARERRLAGALPAFLQQAIASAATGSEFSEQAPRPQRFCDARISNIRDSLRLWRNLARGIDTNTGSASGTAFTRGPDVQHRHPSSKALVLASAATIHDGVSCAARFLLRGPCCLSGVFTFNGRLLGIIRIVVITPHWLVTLLSTASFRGDHDRRAAAAYACACAMRRHCLSGSASFSQRRLSAVSSSDFFDDRVALVEIFSDIPSAGVSVRRVQLDQPPMEPLSMAKVLGTDAVVGLNADSQAEAQLRDLQGSGACD